MLTPDQIKNLKEGDPLIIHGTYKGKHSDGDLRITSIMTVGDSLEDSIKTVHPSCVSLPSEHGTSPQHDPFRLFKEGDRVKPRSVFGRKLYIKDVLYEVMWDESCNKISVKDLISAETLVGMPSVFFELITPVEEQEPYKVDECGFAPTLYVRKNGKVYMTIPYKEGSSLFQTHEEALAAAEAECKRLNAEYRKEH